ncbi:MAG: aldo/keto reductase, partial [Firmicutes bacterium]|nr:aldo/keto reductase [Candidatus Colimorpha enterica]
MEFVWGSKALMLAAPKPENVDRFCNYVRTKLKDDGIDTLFLLTRYNFEFDTHPECRGEYPISKEDAKNIAAACREAGIKLIPKMNLLGHQSDWEVPRGIVAAHPELDENGTDKVDYCRTLCPTHPDSLGYVLDLADEMIDTFGAKDFHIGCDEVFEIGKCPRCKATGKTNAELFSEWVNKIASHLFDRGVQVYMWGDRLLDSVECQHGPWDASRVGTADAIDTVDKRIIICDWHYYNWWKFPSVEKFAEKGFKIYLCPFNTGDQAEKFLSYAKEHDHGHILGVCETTWMESEYFVDYALGDRTIPDNEDDWAKKAIDRVYDCYERALGLKNEKKMIYNEVCGEKLSLLGFGTMRLPKNEDGSIDEGRTEEMVEYALDMGVNYFDTAWPYHGGMSEIVIGKCLKRHRRDEYYLASKYPGHQIAESYDPAAIFEKQLEKCGVDYFDFYLLHNVYEKSIETYKDEKWGIIDYFLEQKRKGRIKHLGFSSHARPDCLREFLDYCGDKMEFCQIQLNYLDWTLQEAKEKYDLLTERNIPVWVMEPVRGGRLANLSEKELEALGELRDRDTPVHLAFRFLQSLPNVKMILSGMSDYLQMMDNIRTFSERKPLSGEEISALLNAAEAMKGAVPCTGCRYCTDGCPMGLDIPDII